MSSGLSPPVTSPPSPSVSPSLPEPKLDSPGNFLKYEEFFVIIVSYLWEVIMVPLILVMLHGRGSILGLAYFFWVI